MGLPCKFKSINNVSRKSSSGNGCGFRSDHTVLDDTDSLFCFNDRTFNFFNLPIAVGRLTIELPSKFNSLSATKFMILSGILAKLLDDRSSFSNEVRVGETMLGGILEKELLARRIVFRPLGRLLGRALAFGLTGCGRPNRLLLADSVLSLVNREMSTNVPGESLLSSTFKDLSNVRLAILGFIVESLFLDKSSVVSLVILAKGELDG
jgi:hypothetical protein